MPGYSVTFSVVDQATAQIEAINRRIRQMREPIERQARAIQQFVDLSGLKKVADSFTAIGRSAADAFSSMVRLVPVMGAITGAASLAGLANLVKGWDDFADQLQQNATRINTTTQTLQQWQTMMQLAGGTADQATDSLKGLADGLGAAQRGDATAAQWFQRFHINLRNANGSLRTAVEVMPEVLAALNSMPQPLDRARAGQEAFGRATTLMSEQIQRSGKSLQQLREEAQKYPGMTDAEIAAANRYDQAMGALSASFTRLRNSVGATLAQALTPLIEHFAKWVNENQPQIIKAVDELARKFKQWVDGIDWNSVQSALKTIGDLLVFIANHAEAIAAIFALKWGVTMVANIGSVTSALGIAGVGLGGLGLLGALGGVLFLGKQIYDNWDDIKKAGNDTFTSLERGWARVTKNMLDYYHGRPSEGLPKPGETPGYPTQPQAPQTFGPPIPGRKTPEGGVPGYPIQPQAPGGAWSTPPTRAKGPVPGYPEQPAVPYEAGTLQNRLHISGAEYDAFRNAVAKIESGCKYDIQGGAGGHFIGRYQLGGLGGHTEIADTARQLNVPTPSIQEFRKNPQEQEKFFEAYTAQHDKYLSEHSEKYRGLTPQQKLAVLGYAHNQGAGGAVKWLESGQAQRDAFGTSADKYSSDITTALNKVAASSPQLPTPSAAANQNTPPAIAAPATPVIANQTTPAVPAILAEQRPVQAMGAPEAMGAPQAMGPRADLATPAAPPVSGSVDVNITHQRPPPGVRLSATATGDVNLSQPRTEQQQLSSVA